MACVPALVRLVKYMWVCCGVRMCVCVCVHIGIYSNTNKTLYSCSVIYSSHHWDIAVCTGHVWIGIMKGRVLPSMNNSICYITSTHC